MITGVLIAVLVIVLVALRYTGRGRARGAGGRARGGGGRGLKRRFGPEYECAVARQDGDVRAAERELGERVRRHGSLQEQPLSPEVREHYVAQWDAVQEQFVDSPQKAGTEEMREAMVEARSLFGAPVAERQVDADRRRRPPSPDGQGHAPWPLTTRRHAKGGGT